MKKQKLTLEIIPSNEIISKEESTRRLAEFFNILYEISLKTKFIF